MYGLLVALIFLYSVSTVIRVFLGRFVMAQGMVYPQLQPAGGGAWDLRRTSTAVELVSSLSIWIFVDALRLVSECCRLSGGSLGLPCSEKHPSPLRRSALMQLFFTHVKDAPRIRVCPVQQLFPQAPQPTPFWHN